MAGDIEIKITGMDEVRKALKNIPPKLAKRITQLALKSAANFMLKNIKAKVPVKSGNLRKSTKVRNSKIHTLKKDGTIGVFIGFNASKGRKKIAKEKNRAGIYGKCQENGWNATGPISRSIRKQKGLPTGKPVPGKHFMLGAYNASKVQTGQILAKAIEVATLETAKELGFKTE